MNNGIFTSISSNIDNRTNIPLPLNNSLRSVAGIFDYPRPNQIWEGYYNSNDYVFVVDTIINNNLTVDVTIFAQAGGILTIDWGDQSYGSRLNSINFLRNGSFETVLICAGTAGPVLSHTYSCHGQYIVKISGRSQADTNSFGTSLSYQSNGVIAILSFGKDKRLTTFWVNSNPNLVRIPEDRPSEHLGNYSANGGVFRSCSKLNDPNISKWNLNNNTNLAAMFWGCSSFNQPISNLVVNSGTSCEQMFAGCSGLTTPYFDNWIFNGNNNTANMFAGCFNFLGNGLSSWNTSGVNNMNRMFFQARRFDQDLGSWDMTNVTNMSTMFGGAWVFNNGNSNSINNWNTSNVTNMNSIFLGCTNFGSGIALNLSGWSVQNVTTTQDAFRDCINFNAIMNGWSPGINTAGAIMTSTFWNCPMFVGSGLETWNVSKVTNMSSMFVGALAFQTDISTWNLAGLNINTALDGFMSGKTGASAYSTANYDALLIGWNNNKLASANGVANWRTDLRPNFGGAKYTSGGAAATARAALVSYGWTITDGGPV